MCSGQAQLHIQDLQQYMSDVVSCVAFELDPGIYSGISAS